MTVAATKKHHPSQKVLLQTFCEDPILPVGGAPKNRPSANEIVAIIANWDLSKPKMFLVVRQGFDAQRVEEMEREYKRFMTMVVNNPDKKFPISNAVDELWHAHILFTGDYNRFSKTTRGCYIQHNPTLNEAERVALEPAYHANTVGIYRQQWGEPDTKWWPVADDICWSCSCSTEEM